MNETRPQNRPSAAPGPTGRIRARPYPSGATITPSPASCRSHADGTRLIRHVAMIRSYGAPGGVAEGAVPGDQPRPGTAEG